MGAASCELRVKSTSGTPLPSRPGPLLEAELSSTLPAALMHSTGSSWRKIYASRVLRAPSPPAAPAAHRWHAGRSRGGGDLSRELLMPARTAPAASSLRRGSRPPRAPPSCPGSRGSAARGARAPASPRRQRPPRAAGAGLGGRLLEGGKRCGGRRGCQRREGPASMLTSRARGPGRLAAALARARAARDPLALVGAGRPAGDALRLCVARLVAHGLAAARLHSWQQGNRASVGHALGRCAAAWARLREHREELLLYLGEVVERRGRKSEPWRPADPAQRRGTGAGHSTLVAAGQPAWMIGLLKPLARAMAPAGHPGSRGLPQCGRRAGCLCPRQRRP